MSVPSLQDIWLQKRGLELSVFSFFFHIHWSAVGAQVRDPIPLCGKMKHGGDKCSFKQLGEVSSKIFNFFFSHSCSILLQKQGIESFEKESGHTSCRGRGPSLFMLISTSASKMQCVHELIFQIWFQSINKVDCVWFFKDFNFLLVSVEFTQVYYCPESSTYLSMRENI